MGILQRLLGGAKKQPSITVTVTVEPVEQQLYADLGDSRGELPGEAWVLRDGRGVTVVGESFRQDAITHLIGGGRGGPVRATFWATLNAETDNPRDPTAVRVDIDGKPVGYVGRGECKDWAPVLARLARDGRVAYCKAAVMGGGKRADGTEAMYGVFAYAAAPAAQLDELAMSLDGKSRAEIAASKPAMKDGRESGPGTYRGRHHSEWHTEVYRLRTMGDDGTAEQLLLNIVDATEAEAAHKDCGVAPGAYELLAIIYSKRKDAATETAILERFAAQRHAPGATPAKLLARLEKARAKQSTKSPTSAAP